MNSATSMGRSSRIRRIAYTLSAFCLSGALLYGQEIDRAGLDKIDGTWCRTRILEAIPNDSSALQFACATPSVVAQGAFFLCPNGCFQIKKKHLVEGREPVVLYQICAESGFLVASFEVNIKHHEKSFVRTFKNPDRVPIQLPPDGSLELNLWEAMIRLGCFR